MAIEDFIWAKNRHMFGGIAPSNMLSFRVEIEPYMNSDGSIDDSRSFVYLPYQLPYETVIDGKVVCTIAGVEIRKKADGYPENEFDGELVSKNEPDIPGFSGSASDVINVDQPMYYAAFPYSKQGVYNRNPANRASINTHSATYIFGYDLDANNDDSYERVTYPSDVDNYGFTAARMNFNTNVFDYGNWNITPGEKFMPRPCMVKYNGTVDYYLDPNDYSKKADGTASDIANTAYSGNAMIEWPKIYTKRWEENGIYHFRCSDAKIDDDWECWCNYDVNNNEIDHFYTGIYRNAQIAQAGVDRLKSISGQTAKRSLNVSNERTLAQKNGDGWDIEIIADHFLIQDLLVMMGKSTNTQDVYGIGGNSSAMLSNGSTNTAGMFYGTNSSTSSMIKIFGMEDYWGVVARRMLGCLYEDNGENVQKMFIKITKGTKDGSAVSDFITDSTMLSEDDFAESFYIESYGSWYITKMTTRSWGRIPVPTLDMPNGSATTYECDYFHVTSSSGGPFIFETGGDYSYSTTTQKGAFQGLLRYLWNSTSAYLGSRLSYKPNKS